MTNTEKNEVFFASIPEDVRMALLDLPNPILSPARVRDMVAYCMFTEGENTDNHVVGEGIVTNIGFHPGRLAERASEIAAMLDQLPDDFKASGGGGMSFLNACNDLLGRQWTGLHTDMEMLFQLGTATGKAKLLLPREMWAILPGGMPYYVLDMID
jgi:hypothetical protein